MTAHPYAVSASNDPFLDSTQGGADARVNRRSVPEGIIHILRNMVVTVRA